MPIVRNQVQYIATSEPCKEEGPEVIVVGALCEDCAGAPVQKSYCVEPKGHPGSHFFVTGLDKVIRTERPF